MTADAWLAWALIALIVLLGGAAALYPIAFYIHSVWASRQRIIFDTLRWQAKELYLRLYHRTESGSAPAIRPAMATLDGPIASARAAVALATSAMPGRGGNGAASANGRWAMASFLKRWLGRRVTVQADEPHRPAPPTAALPVAVPTPEELAGRERAANARFDEVYTRWFGRGRLIAPALIVAAIILCYVLLAAAAAARDMLPNAAWPVTVAIGPVVLASMTGAYILVSMDTIERVTRRDLLPDDLNLSALRLAAAVPLGYAFSSLAKDEAAPFVALAVTALPLRQVADLLRQIGYQRFGQQRESEAPTLDAPSRLSGVDKAVCERLSTVGVNTITQLAYSDPVQLTMRTSLNFVFVLDVVSQALAWVYLESKLDLMRPMGLRGAFEICTLRNETTNPDSPWHAQAVALVEQLPGALGMTREQIDNAFHQIADDDRAQFLLLAY